MFTMSENLGGEHFIIHDLYICRNHLEPLDSVAMDAE